MKIRIDFLDMDFDTSTFPRNRIETNQNDDPVFYCLPSKNEVCERCGGNGTHDHSAFSNGFSRSDDFVDDDFLENYHSGHYDVVCEECHGNRVIAVADEKSHRFTDLDRQVLQYWNDYQRSCAESAAIQAAERRMGA